MISKDIINLKKLDEKEFSAIAWLNNTLRASSNSRNDRSLQDELLNISQSCISTITEYNELVESHMSELNDMFESFLLKNDENIRNYQDLNNKINDFSNTIVINEQKYLNNNSIEEILSLFEQKEKLKTVSQLLTNNSKFESLLHEIENVLQDKEGFIILIKEKKQDFQDIIDKLCSLKLLVSSLESIPEFLVRIERFKNLENGIISILDRFFCDLFIENSNEDIISELIDIYSKLGRDSRLCNHLLNIISEQIFLVWKLVWSLTTFGSQNRSFDSEYKTNSEKMRNNDNRNSNIILSYSIEDLTITNISQDIFRIREDEAITRYFNWFNQLINSRNQVIDKIIVKSKNNKDISYFTQNIIKKLFNTCIPDIQDFLKTILISITNSKFIFPENISENFEIENESIFEVGDDSILTTDIKEVKVACERTFKSFFSGIELVFIIDYSKNNYNFLSYSLNSDIISQISDIILNNADIIQSILLCDIAWIFQCLKSTSSQFKSIINNQISVSDYSNEIDSKCAVLLERINSLLINEYSGDNLCSTPIPLKNYIIFFVSVIDFSIKFFFENDLIHLLNPIQSLIRSQTLNLIKGINQKQSVNNSIITNILDKQLLYSCFSFHSSILRVKKNVANLIIKVLNHCKSTLSNFLIANNQDKKSFLSLIIFENINLKQYSVFNKIRDSVTDLFIEQLSKILEEDNTVNYEILSKFESIKFISQISLDSVDIIAQCCSYPVLAFFEGYNRLDFWDDDIDNKIIPDAPINSDLQSMEQVVMTLIEKSAVQPCNPIVSIGEYLLNIAVTLESISSNSDIQLITESESLIPEIIKRVLEILEDTIRRQVIEIEYINTKGCLQLFVDMKYLLNISEILLLYNKHSESQVNDNENNKEDNYLKTQELKFLSKTLLFILTKTKVEFNEEKGIQNWYETILKKKRNC